MPSAATNLSSLRQLLATRFPQASRPAGGVLPTGIPAVDEATGGGLPRPALTELACSGPGAGGQLFLAQLLASTRTLPARVALIDASDQFDPQSFPAEDLQHLLWVRCRATTDALPVADLLAREPNLDLVVLDLAAAAPAELRRVPSTTWYRLQRAVGQTDLAFLILTPVALVPSAQLRLRLEKAHGLAAQALARPHLAVDLEVARERQRLAAAQG